MKNHTPGPWSVCARANNMIDVIHHNRAPGAITRALCRVQARAKWVAEAEANANLIAAAPDLLEALRVILNISLMDTGPWAKTVAIEARAAIAKATGEQV